MEQMNKIYFRKFPQKKVRKINKFHVVSEGP